MASKNVNIRLAVLAELLSDEIARMARSSNDSEASGRVSASPGALPSIHGDGNHVIFVNGQNANAGDRIMNVERSVMNAHSNLVHQLGELTAVKPKLSLALNQLASAVVGGEGQALALEQKKVALDLLAKLVDEEREPKASRSALKSVWETLGSVLDKVDPLMRLYEKIKELLG